MTTAQREILRKWVAALRSGRYEQGARTLRRRATGMPDQFCCLGVLCDVVAPEDWKVHQGFGNLTHRGEQWYPDISVLGVVGLSASQARELGAFNDDDEKSFEEIAVFIEDKYIKEDVEV